MIKLNNKSNTIEMASFTTKELIEAKIIGIIQSNSTDWTLYHETGYNPTVCDFLAIAPLTQSKRFSWKCPNCEQLTPLVFKENNLQVWVYTINTSKIYYLCECNCDVDERKNILRLAQVISVPISFQQIFVDTQSAEDIFLSDFLPSYKK